MSSSKSEDGSTQVCIVLFVYDHPGVMMKITGMFARRGFNIASITVGHSEREGFSRITIVAEGDEATIEQIIKQLHKLIEVIKVYHLFPQNTTMRELALIKVNITNNSDRSEVLTIVEIFKSKVVDITTKTMTLEIIGTEKKVSSFIELVAGVVGVREIVRSGIVALGRGEDSISLE